MEFQNIKIKYINEQEFLSYLDWLTRFKNPIDNLIRVCDKLLVKNLIFPKFSAKKIQEITFFEKVNIAKYIWILSLENLFGHKFIETEKLKTFLIFEECKTFDTDFLLEYIKNLDDTFENRKEYIKIRKELFLPIDELVDYFAEKNIDVPFFNRLYSKKMSDLPNDELFNERCDFASVKLLFLVEGITEEKLFPLFAQIYNLKFDECGIKLKAAGGKTHLLKYYTENRKLFKIPIFILLDADGTDILGDLNSVLLSKDVVYLISKGEIEDILPHSLIIKSINNFYETAGCINNADLDKDEPMTKILYKLYKEKGFGEFHKAKFAQILQENITSKEDILGEIKEILAKIKNFV